MTIYILLFLAGLGRGFLAGLLGIGGGIIYILILPEALTYLHVPSKNLPSISLPILSLEQPRLPW